MKDNNSNGASAGGIGLCGALTIAFIVLKLLGKISWSWVWVLAPIWIPAALVIIVLLGLLVAAVIESRR